MAREEPFAIFLSRAERKTLLAAARKHTAPYCEVMRAKAILLAADGLSTRKVGELLELPRPIVSKWRKSFFEKRLAGLRS